VRKRHVVVLSEQERARLHTMIGRGIAPASALIHARILLKANQGQAGPGWTDAAVGAALEVNPATVARVRMRYAAAGLDAAADRAALAPAAARQREPYAGQVFPEPGEDPELEAIVTEALGPWLRERPTGEGLRQLAERIRAHVGLENKRKNLLGEGFEDTIAATHSVHVRPRLHTLPGFYRPREGEPPPEVDLALVRRADGRRTLVTCKWSVRSDRERQFGADFLAYTAKDQGRGFDYVLVTNEFDPARLAAACDNRRENALIFSDVVHVNLDGPLAAYGSRAGAGRERGGICPHPCPRRQRPADQPQQLAIQADRRPMKARSARKARALTPRLCPWGQAAV
jgi:hypothetical protein